MADIVIRNITVFQTEPPFDIIENADVVITGSTIERVGVNAADGVNAGKMIDGSGKILMKIHESQTASDIDRKTHEITVIII